MGINNFMQVLQQYNSFKQMLNTSGRNPEELLRQELNKRNLSSQQIGDLLDSAKMLSKLFGGRL